MAGGVTYVEVGTTGERIDKKEYITNWENVIRSSSESDEILKKVKEEEALTSEEEQLISERLNQPKMYFNEENLRRAYKNPAGTLIDFIRAALGSLKLKSREEELTENFHAWLVTKNLTPEQAQYLSLLKNRGIVKGKVEVNDLFQPPLSILNAARVGIELFGEKNLKEIIEDMNKSVFIRKTA